MEYRNLTEQEISMLIFNGCSCTDWNKVSVDKNFDPINVKNSRFSGNVKLGTYAKEIEFFGGVKKPTGIYNATIHNCEIGHNVYIGNVENYIANYIIADNAVIENVDIIAVSGESSFGNGIEVAVLNEAGGREIPIFDKLSAQIAYILALYRHKTKLINKLHDLIEQYTNSVKSKYGTIGKGAKILNCRTIKNVRFGEYCTVEGIYRLNNGTINSTQEAPTYFGEGVIVEDFIAASGSKITDATLVSHCFIGQGTHLGKHYSAENSVFFANCMGLHGEACSIFAGPFTVTHHKSTLLIAGLFSFLNAGSGSNQSNHMYKLGPIHQGIVERGSKTTSDSYILWPAKIGVFSLVMGRHYKNSDISDLPFSYLIESKDESILVPGVNLRSVGTIRDAQKWPLRDVRTANEKLDIINFNLLSPFIVGKIIKGRNILRSLMDISGENSESYSYQSVKIQNSSLHNGIALYDLAIKKFLGNAVVKKIETSAPKTKKELRNCLLPHSEYGVAEWIDMAGLYSPKELMEEKLDDLETGVIENLNEFSQSLEDIHVNYYNHSWNWIYARIFEEKSKNIDDFTVKEMQAFISEWLESVVELDKKLLSDAKKEFRLTAQTGFGIDGDYQIRVEDFEQVRGDFERNKVVIEIKEHIKKKTILGEKVLDIINKIK